MIKCVITLQINKAYRSLFVASVSLFVAST